MIYESDIARRVEQLKNAIEKVVRETESNDPKVAAAARERFAAIEKVITEKE